MREPVHLADEFRAGRTKKNGFRVCDMPKAKANFLKFGEHVGPIKGKERSLAWYITDRNVIMR